MALQASYFPSSSSSSSFSYEWPYHVFLSFRGSDTRHGFTGNLYKALSDKGIHTFFDDQELQGGEEITPALVKAIQDSRIAIVVFSLNYASSSFCLHELATIMDCVKGKGRLVLPVFYGVDPCDVRHQKGSYGEAMTKHEERFQNKKEKLQKWREALRQAADLSGEHFKLGNEYEYVCIEKIVKVISKKISRLPLHIAEYPVGLVSRVLKVNSLLNNGFDCRVRMVGIYGIGGIGKTTLARAIYNFIADQFECLCFLENVREKSINLGLVHLQKTLLSQILGDDNIDLGSVNQGIPIIKQRLHRKKVLLVLDDVNERKQLQATVGADWFGSSSIVIITTRDKHLLASHGIGRNYEVKGLSQEIALKLLCWNAFKDENIDPTYMDILKHAITYACGLPLALEVIGSNLFGKSIEEWRSALDQYEKIPSKEIQKILKISFDTLEECHQKIFLDIACCFNGYNWVKFQDILHARHDVSMKYGISVLVQKSLLMSDKDGCVAIHDLIRDMGREIIRQESPKHPGNRSRLWIPEDVVRVLEENTGTGEIEIMILDAPELENIFVQWDGETFKKMRNLEILIIRNARLSQGAKHLPNSLRVLEWSNYPSNSLPSDFYPKKLAIFELPCSSLMSVGFVDKRKFMNLEVLKLDKSNIEYIPDVSGVPNLRMLSFQQCKNLIKVHESVGFLDKLSELGVLGCSKLKSFPALMLPCLAKLNFTDCSSLENFPEILGDMESVTNVYLFNTSIKELPYSLTNLWNLVALTIGHVNRLYQVSGRPDSHVRGCGELQFPKQDEDEGQGSSMVSSKVVNVSFGFYDTQDEFFAMFLSLFCHMVTLDLSRNDFTILPEGIKELCSLRKLTLDDCKELREIRGIPPNIEEFSASNCMSLTPSCRSMLLNEEYYSRNGYGYERFYFPGDNIPKWFEHSSRYSFSFWFRNKPPSTSVCVVCGPDRFSYLNTCFSAEVFINGNNIYSCVLHSSRRFTSAGHHIVIFNQGRILSNHELAQELLSENKWNHMVFRVGWSRKLLPLNKNFGIHVHKHESNMEDIRFTDPPLQEKEVNMGGFHRDTEQEKNLTTLASVETQQGKWLSLYFPQVMNSLNDNVNGDLNSGSADLSKDKGKDLMVYNHSSEENSMHSWGQELLDKNWESNSMKFASPSDTIREGSDDDSRKRDKELLSLRPCWEEPLDCENLESNLMQLAATSHTIKDQDTDVDPSSVPPATQLHSDPWVEPTLLCRSLLCWGKPCNHTEREIEEMEGVNWKREEAAAGPSSGVKQEIPQNPNEAFHHEEEEEAGEEEEEEGGGEGGGNDDHKNTTFVPGPLLPLKDQIERDKEDESLRRWKEKLVGCLERLCLSCFLIDRPSGS